MMIYLIRRTLPSIGDAICLEPVISLTHEMIVKKGGELWLQCDERIADFFQNHPLIDQILFAEQEPPNDINMVLDISDANQCPSIRALMTGQKINAVQLFCDNAHVDGQTIVYDGRSPRLYYSDEEKQRINFIKRSFGKKLVAVQRKAGHWWKAYPHFETLVRQLFKLDNIQLFITDDEPIPFKHNGIIPLTQLPYKDLKVWLGAMDLFIGLDSGPTHVAAAVGTRTYALFGPTDPKEIIGMYGSHVSWNKFAAARCPRERCWLRPCKKVICLRALSPWGIVHEAKKLLSEGYENPRIRFAETPFRPFQVDAKLPDVFPRPEVSIPKTRETALMRLDGLGGTMTLADQAKKIHEHTGKKVTMITRGYEILFENNPHVEKIINVGMRDWRECSTVYKNAYQALAEVRFGLGKWHSHNGNFNQDFTDFSELFNQFPIDFNQLSKYGLHHVQLTDKTLGLPSDSIDVDLYMDDEEFEIDGDFILVNNGVDVIHKGMRQTKCWERWDELTPLLSARVVQVGTLNDPPIDGVVDIRGKTTLRQLAYLLKKAKVVLATEGGIMHLSYAVKSENVVILGGPTQGVLFEYPGHKWITSYICGDCWSTRGDWYVKCPKDVDNICMKTISPHRVAEVINEIYEG